MDPFVWPALAAVGIVSIVSAWLPRERARRLWPLGGVLALGAAAGTMVGMSRAGGLGYAAAYDAVGSLMANGLPVLVAAGIGVRLTRRGVRPLTRLLASVAVGALLTLPAPYIVLVVHCFSGDCL